MQISALGTLLTLSLLPILTLHHKLRRVLVLRLIPRRLILDPLANLTTFPKSIDFIRITVRATGFNPTSAFWVLKGVLLILLLLLSYLCRVAL